MAEPAHPRMTVAEFLAWDDGTDTRYELIDGVPVAMAPASEQHATIAGNVIGRLAAGIPSACRVLPEVGVGRDDAPDVVYIPNIAVSCAEARPGSRRATEPVMLVEVTSPSTGQVDRAVKLPFYRAIPTVRTILILSSDERRAEHWERRESGWFMQDLIGDAVIRVESLGIDLPMADIYRNTHCQGKTDG